MPSSGPAPLSESDPYTVGTDHWHSLPDGRIQCDVCPRACRLREGQRGLCFVRGRVGDQVVLASYGRSSGFCVDPVEKKPLHHFLPGTPVLSFGTAGCNLGCRFCQNWDISKSREIDTLSGAASPDALAAVAERLGCRSIAFTYNDPTVFFEYAADIAQACAARGIRSVAVSAGFMNPKPREEFYRHIDAANIDLKAFTESFYEKIAFAKLATVLETLEYLRHETSVWLEITTLLIPGHNDSDEELTRQCAWIAARLGTDVPLHFSAFHPDFKMRDVPPTPPETLHRARRIARDHGLRFVYTGNIHDPEGQTTYCPGCGEAVVVRDRYVLNDYRLGDTGECAACGHRLPGVFDGPAGDWGARRRPIRLAPPASRPGPHDRRRPAAENTSKGER
ncbi:pyruvate formate lyase activating enzyme [Stackebrandtia albiflava]|uniref:Pyruvate formate lyase activating enzyme n=1 Tax=Stackebrandtia albiflava TaxID=406432 RepID=A0A562V1P5_9ACTN|nr:AmmeMemoRadiSam system radical SAM enzyme [Stackebrandtia albiflava]TWJ11794.1 pyruvate formate lyase activating enzyme [Stackebrandtia albiflava]